MQKFLRGLAFIFVLLLWGSMGFAEESLVISEIMASNASVSFDGIGGFPDWINIENRSGDCVDMSGMHLSDGQKDLEKFTFPEGTMLNPGDTLLVLCTGESLPDTAYLTTAFKLGKDGETLTLSQQGRIIDRVTFPALAQGEVYARQSDGTYAILPHAQILPVEGTPAPAPQGVYISEILTSSAQIDPDRSDDWLELHNPTTKNVSLRGWTLSLANGKSFTLPAANLGAGNYLLVYCTEENIDYKGALRAPFALSAEGGTITLQNAEGEVQDTLAYARQYGNISCGRAVPGDVLLFFEKATPGGKNAPGYSQRSIAPTFAIAPGFCEGRITLAFSGTGEIRYTTDGAEPTQDAALYEAPLTLEKTTAVRIRTFEEGKLPSAITSGTYLFEVSPSVPVVALITDNTYLYGAKGLMATGNGRTPNYMQEWEYPMHIEYYALDGASQLHQDAGFRIAGETSRRYAQKGMVITARNAYAAPGTLNFSPFSSLEAASFNSFKAVLLRSAGSEGAANGVRFRDALLTSLAEGTHVLYQSAQPVLVFLNGKNYGHYNLREKVNKHFVAQHEGITDKETIDNIDLLKRTGMVLNGSADDYLALVRFIRKNDLNVPANLDYVLSQMDIDSYFDHCIFEILVGNEDINNYKFYRVPGGKWKWILFDLDTAMGKLNEAPLSYYLRDVNASSEHGFDHAPFAALMQVDEMRDRFLVRMGEILAEKFAPAYLSAQLDAWTQTLTPLLPYQYARWEKLTQDNWQGALDKFSYFLRERPKAVVTHVQSAFSLSDAQVQHYFGAFLAQIPES